ncbi:MAG: hypothetical protein K5753_04805 [Clostridia bacterium]|nr:hypothetical protein [Clostridia bacterium]
MRSGRGKCPQCKETIVIDLDQPELRCPYCNALLKKSAKSVSEVKAEEKARIKAAEEKEKERIAAEEEAEKERLIAEEKAKEEALAAEKAAEEKALAEKKAAEEKALAEQKAAEEKAKEEALAAEKAKEEKETPAADEEESEFGEDALKQEALNAANEISDEELAMMDETFPEEEKAEEAPAEEAEPIEATEETPASEEIPAEEAAESEAETPVEEAPVEETPAEESADDFDESLLADIPDAIVGEIPAEETPVEEQSAEETSDLISDEVPEEEAPAPASDETMVYSSIAMDDDVPAEKEESEEEDDEPEEEEDLSKKGEVALEDDGSSFDDISPDLISDAAPETAPAEEAAENEESEVSDEDAALFDDETPAFLTPDSAEESAVEETAAEEAPVEESVAEETAAEEAELDVPEIAEPETEESASVEPEVAEPEVAEPETAEPEVAEPESTLEIESPEVEEPAPAESASEEVKQEAEPEVEETRKERRAREKAAKKAEEEAAAQETPAYTDEDMAFAASLSDLGTRRYVAPKSAGAKKAIRYVAPGMENGKKQNKAEREQKAAPAGGKTMGIYKKPIAFLLMLLSIAGVLIYLAYGLFITHWADYGLAVMAEGKITADLIAGAPSLLGQLPKTWLSVFIDKLPLIGGDYFLQYATIGFCGAVALISILGLTGKKGKLGFLFVLLADAVFCFYTLWSMHGGTPYFITIEKLPEILAEYGKYVDYGVYGLLLLAAIAFAVSLSSGSSEFGTTAGTAVLPIIYMAILVAGYAAILVLPGVMKITITATIMRYAILGVWGVSLLFTLIGIHNGSTSRGVNGWLTWALLTAMTLFYAAIVVLSYVGKELDVTNLLTLFTSVAPGLPLLTFASFAASDLRN